MTTDQAGKWSADQDKKFHTFATHRIPWYVRAMWIAFWIGLIRYLVKFAIPSAKNCF